MADGQLEERLESLEIRYSHQEAALEELTHTLLAQEQALKNQSEQIERLQCALKAMETGSASVDADEKPPHY